MGTTIGEWLCLLLPWHKFRSVRKLYAGSELVECKHCRRLWAMNHDVQSVLPWHTVEDFYRRQDEMLAEAIKQ